MEKQIQALKPRPPVWDCESSLYDSFELQSLQRRLDSAISTRTMSMPHLSSSRQPPPSHHKPTSKKHFKLLPRSLNKLLRSVFRFGQNHQTTSRGEGFYVYDTSTALSTIPEAPEMLSPLVTRTASDRFMPTSLGISCA